MAELDLATEQARVAQLHEQADAVLGKLRAKLAAVREVQQHALAMTGEASSADGSVRAVVDATGVVTSLVFTPAAFQRGTPERLAQATVATIQVAATKARAQVTETMAPVRTSSSEVLTAAGQAIPELRSDNLSVPAVPRTATDPTEPTNPWPSHQPSSSIRPAGTEWSGTDQDEDNGGSIMREGSW